MNIPKHTILKALSAAIQSGAIKPAEVKALLPKPDKPSLAVAREFHVKAKALTVAHGLDKDGLRFSVQRSTARLTLMLMLLVTEGERRGSVAAPRIGETVAGLDDLDRAAEVVLARYLETLA